MNNSALALENKALKEQIVQMQIQIKNLQLELKSLRELKQLKSGTVEHQDHADISVIGGVQTKRFKMVTVLFSSIKGFNQLHETKNAQELIDELDTLYFEFDTIVERCNIKKIKSLGDTYMCAGGIPQKNRTNPIEVVLAAMQIMDLLRRKKQENAARIWDISLGIHTGPVQAIISGKKNISYELKGDAANIASRIEAYSSAGKIIISDMTYEFVRDFFICDKIGGLPVKYTGVIDMYEVIGFKPKFSDDDLLVIPNERFKLKLTIVRFADLEEYILNRLEKELPHYLYYHNVKHTMDVLIGVEVIGVAEKVNEEELLLLKTAALFHDMGQIVQSKGHEEISCKYARDILPHYEYSQKHIDAVCELIMATQLPPNPKNLLQKIMCDSDLDYLGRTDFIPVSDTLYEELHYQNIISNKNDWNKMQIAFISKHQYFTNFAKQNREVNKQNQIKRLKQLIVE
jgi:class 3 adenylate cyclase